MPMLDRMCYKSGNVRKINAIMQRILLVEKISITNIVSPFHWRRFIFIIQIIFHRFNNVHVAISFKILNETNIYI
jgi:hypothetical protein